MRTRIIEAIEKTGYARDVELIGFGYNRARGERACIVACIRHAPVGSDGSNLAVFYFHTDGGEFRAHLDGIARVGPRGGWHWGAYPLGPYYTGMEYTAMFEDIFLNIPVVRKRR